MRGVWKYALVLAVVASACVPVAHQDAALDIPSATAAWTFRAADGAGGSAGRVHNDVGSASATLSYSGQAHIWYYDDDASALRHSWGSGTGWAYEALDGPGSAWAGATSNDVGSAVATVLYEGLPHVFYRDETDQALRHAWWSGFTWSFEVLDGAGSPWVGATTTDDVGSAPSAVLYDGLPHVFYRDATTQSLRHASWSGSEWSFQTLDGVGASVAGAATTHDVGGSSSAIEAKGLLHVFAHDATAGALRHALFDGSVWAFSVVDGKGAFGSRTTPNNVGSTSSATVLNNALHVFYRDDDAASLRHAVWDRKSWVRSVIDGEGASSAGATGDDVGASTMALATNGNVHVFYTAHTPTPATDGLRHAVWNGISWVHELLDGAAVANDGQIDTGVGGRITALALGADLHTWYYGLAEGSLRHAVFGVRTQPVPVTGAITSLTTSPLALSPAFSPTVHDYVLRCAAGTNSVTIDVDPASITTVALATVDPGTAEPAVGDTVATGASMTTQSTAVTVDLLEDQAAVLTATPSSGPVETYWIRCLPSDFPVLSAVHYPAAGSPTPGWYFTGNTTVAGGEAGYAMVLDGNGTPVWYHRAPGGGINVIPWGTNEVAFAPFLGPGYGVSTQGDFTIAHLETWQRETVRTVPALGITEMPTDLHEIQRLPNDDRVLISYPLVSGVDLSGLDPLLTSVTIFDCIVQQVDPLGQEVWTWRMSDHVDPNTETTFNNSSDGAYDVFHCNSVDVDGDSVLVSARHTNAVYLISKSTGQIIWKVGGTGAVEAGGQVLEVQNTPAATFSRQHDARFLPNGNISLFDNHEPLAGVARGMELDLDTGAGTATVVWEYDATFASRATGSFRRYSDGTSLVGWGIHPNGGGSLAFTEVNAAGQPLWEVSFGPGVFLYRAVKAPLAQFDVDVLRRTAGRP